MATAWRHGVIQAIVGTMLIADTFFAGRVVPLGLLIFVGMGVALVRGAGWRGALHYLGPMAATALAFTLVRMTGPA